MEKRENSLEIGKSSNEIQKKINDENIALQEKWNKETLQFQEKTNKANIDANLIAAARIDWIQNVRKTTSELLTHVNKCLTPLEKEYLMEVTLQAEEKIELLILYFGNENTNPSEKASLDKSTDNKGKNKEIVDFLSFLSKKLSINFEMAKNEKLENLKKFQERRLSEMQNYTLDWNCYEVEDEYANIHQAAEPVLEEEYEEKLSEIQDEISKMEQQSIGLEKDTIRLREIIRLYLKMEWTKAKTGS